MQALPPALGGGIVWDLQNEKVAGMRDKLARLVTRVNATTKSQIADVVTEGLRRGYGITQIANGYADEKYGGVAGVFDATDARAELISRTETGFALNGAQALGFRENGVESVEILDGTGDEGCADIAGSTQSVDWYDANPLEHPACTRSAVPTDAPGDRRG